MKNSNCSSGDRRATVLPRRATQEPALLKSTREGLQAFWNPNKTEYAFPRPGGKSGARHQGPLLKIWPTPPSIPRLHQLSGQLHLTVGLTDAVGEITEEEEAIDCGDEEVTSFLRSRSPGDGCVSPEPNQDDKLPSQSTSDSNCCCKSSDLMPSHSSHNLDGEDYEESSNEYGEEEYSSMASTSCATSRASSAVSHSNSNIDLDQLRENAVASKPPLEKQSVASRKLSYPLQKSLFEDQPPTLYFTLENEEVLPLPYDIRRVLKWKMSTITPKVVKACLIRSGFKLTKRSNDWIGTWGKHMKATTFKAVESFQKVNHFPGTFQIGRKDTLWKNYTRMQLMFGKKEFNYSPKTFLLPADFKQLKKYWDSGGCKQKWIIKPPASARGIGIRVIHKWSQLPRKRPAVVQRYISNPLLINGNKFDLRVYVYVTCYDPLRIYLFEDGLVRFATEKYSTTCKSLSNRFAHLTNYSINKKNKAAYNPENNENSEGFTHKWSLKSLWSYLRKAGISTTSLWECIKDIIIKTIISSEAAVNSLVKQNVRSKFSCHELFGFDILLDSNLKPWILEVNISPSLHSTSNLDMEIKSRLVKDMLNLAGLRIPRKLIHPMSRLANTDAISADNNWFETQQLTDEQRIKHALYSKKHVSELPRSTILASLTSDDAKVLMETEDENSRKGAFQRIFPSATSSRFAQFFDTQALQFCARTRRMI